MDAIERLLRRAAATPGLITFAGGLPSPEQFPRRALMKAFIDAVARPSCEPLQYGWPEGSEGLRRFIAAGARARGVDVSSDDVIVTSGAQQALAVAATLLAARGSQIVTESETYPGALAAFRAHGLAIRAARLGDARTFAKNDAVYVMPAVGNPGGHALSAAEREALVTSGATLIEDDAYADLRFGGPPEPLLAGAARDRTFAIGTFSKTLAPGLRVGWLIPPPAEREAALVAKRDADLQANGLAQAIVERYLATTSFDHRLRRLRRAYARRAAELLAAIRRHAPTFEVEPPLGGFALWVRLPSVERAPSETELLEAAIAEGVSFDPGSQFRPDGNPWPLACRLSFSLSDPMTFDEGAQRLARAFARVTQKAA